MLGIYVLVLSIPIHFLNFVFVFIRNMYFNKEFYPRVLYFVTRYLFIRSTLSLRIVCIVGDLIDLDRLLNYQYISFL